MHPNILAMMGGKSIIWLLNFRKGNCGQILGKTEVRSVKEALKIFRNRELLKNTLLKIQEK